MHEYSVRISMHTVVNTDGATATQPSRPCEEGIERKDGEQRAILCDV